jgi:tRNA dimethylallyltransferase
VFSKQNNKLSIITILIVIGFMIIGFLDDYLKIKLKENKGLSVLQKLIFVISVSLIASFIAYDSGLSFLYLPFTNKKLNIGYFTIILNTIVFVATVNSVNLTDGLDGLCSSVSATFFIALSILILLEISYDKSLYIVVSEYKNLTDPIIKDLLSKGKIPVICGGTGFYINSILYDLSYGNGKGDEKVREKYKKIADEKGNEYVFNLLKTVDPESATKIHPNDVKRVIRALEIAETGTIKSKILDDFKPKYDYDAYSIDFDRDTLYDRINKRVDSMIKEGLINEVQTLIDQGITIQNQCMQGIGYKEIYSFLLGEISLENAIDLIKLNTRHYAKRQITFFKKLPNLKLLTPDDPKILAQRIVDSL